MKMSFGIGVIDILVCGFACVRGLGRNKWGKKKKVKKWKEKNLEKKVKEGDCGSIDGFLEGDYNLYLWWKEVL